MGDAIEAHDAALEYGGRVGVSDLSLVQSAIARPYSGYHRPIANKAAALLESVSANHGFTDGNKRTAWLLVELLIDRSGYALNIPDDAPVDDLVVAIVTKEIDFQSTVTWFKERLIRKT